MTKDSDAAFIVIGHSGQATIYYKPRKSHGAVTTGNLSTYADSPEFAAAIAAGVRGYDMRSMSLESAIEMAFSGPMYDYGGALTNSGLFDYDGRKTLDDCGFGPMDYAPAETLMELAARRGATLINKSFAA